MEDAATVLQVIREFSQTQWNEWMDRLLDGAIEPTDPILKPERDDDLVTSLYALFRALSPTARYRFRGAVAYCLRYTPTSESSAKRFEVLLAVVTFSEPPALEATLDSLLSRDFIVRLLTSDGETLRYQLTAARFRYHPDTNFLHYLDRVCTDESFYYCVLVAKKAAPVDANLAQRAFDLALAKTSQVSFQQARKAIQSCGMKILASLDSHSRDEWLSEVLSSNHKIWNEWLAESLHEKPVVVRTTTRSFCLPEEAFNFLAQSIGEKRKSGNEDAVVYCNRMMSEFESRFCASLKWDKSVEESLQKRIDTDMRPRIDNHLEIAYCASRIPGIYSAGAASVDHHSLQLRSRSLHDYRKWEEASINE